MTSLFLMMSSCALALYTKEGWSRYAFVRIIIIRSRAKSVHTVKRSTAELQCNQTVKYPFAMWSSSKNDSQEFLTLVTDVTMASMGVSLP